MPAEAAVEPAEEAALRDVRGRPATGLSSVAHSAGVSDSAMKAEKPIEADHHSENWR